MEKKEITLAEVLSLTGPAQHITVTNEGRIEKEQDTPIYKGVRVKLTKSDNYECLKGRVVKHISTVYDDTKLQAGGKPERGIYIVLRG